jgi:hypothetical protein
MISETLLQNNVTIVTWHQDHPILIFLGSTFEEHLDSFTI